MEIVLFFMIIGFAGSLILLYQRKKNWATEKNRWYITFPPFLIGISGFMIKGLAASEHGFQFLFIPFIYNCFDRVFKYASVKKNGRDFCLYLRYSNEIDDRMFGHNPHIKTLDKLFSILLLFIILALMFSGILVYRAYWYTNA